MQKVVVTLLTIILFTSFLPAQDDDDGKFDKLFDLYIMEKYEDCLKKSINYTENDKYSKDPLPFLYAAMCSYEITQVLELQEIYPSALKDAMKYAAKFKSKDKNGTYYKDNISFFNKLKKAGIEEAETYYQLEDYRKASLSYKQILKFDDDPSIQFIYGVCSFLANNPGEGKMSITSAMKTINSEYKADKISEPLLVNAFIAYSDYLNKKNLADSAKATISLAQQILNTNTDISNQYSKIFGE